MRFSVAAAAVLSAAAASVQAQNSTTWNVIVGMNETLTYTPSFLENVAAGDTVSFQFVSKNHSVTQSSFADPCTANGVSSGFQDVADVNATSFPTWSITVENATSPLWFFCAQTTNTTTHCQDGMVFAINPTASKSFTAFQAAANATNATSPAGQNPSGSVVTAAGGPVSTGSLGTQSAEIAAPSATIPANSTTSNSTGSATSGSTSPTTSNAAMKMSGSSVSLLAVAGLFAGLAL